VAAPNRVMRAKRATLKRHRSKIAWRILCDSRCKCGEKAVITYPYAGGVKRYCRTHMPS